MIAVFMRDKNSFHFVHRQIKPLHSFFRFPAGDACINQYSLLVIANIITIAVAAGVQGSDEKGHGQKYNMGHELCGREWHELREFHELCEFHEWRELA